MLSLDVIKAKSNLKVDLRILQDENVQCHNQEVDSSVLEASKSSSSAQKFQSDHCKLIECKTIIDIYTITHDIGYQPSSFVLKSFLIKIFEATSAIEAVIDVDASKYFLFIF